MDEARMASAEFNIQQLAGRIRAVEKALDTRATPLRRRVLFLVDGWPPWPYVAERPAWRPWRRWWTS